MNDEFDLTRREFPLEPASEQHEHRSRKQGVTWKMIKKLVDAGMIVRQPAESQYSESRQSRRLELRAKCFRDVSIRYPHETRRSRRNIARAMAKQLWEVRER